ncbi:MAG TPA: hypothetical protein VGD81_07935 [Opitutaceae bacterium]
MPGPTLTTDAFVLLKRPPGDSFQSFTVFSPEHGTLLTFQRVPKKPSAAHLALDLFDEVALILDSSNQGQTWFVKETRLLARHGGIGRNYDALRFASALAALVARNPVPEESRSSVAALLRTAFAAFGRSARPDIVYLKSLYVFARDEGYPVKQEWLPTLPAGLRAEVIRLLGTPLAEIEPAVRGGSADAALLQRRLEDYLRGHTEILLD